MTEKVKKTYSGLSTRTKICIVVSVFAIFLTSFIYIAAAGSGISFSGQTPSSGSVTGEAMPVISVQASAEEGTVAADDVEMSLNGVPVMSTLSGSTISHTPAQKLEDGLQSVSVSVYDTMAGMTTTNWSFTVDAVPNPSNWFPAKNSTTNLPNPTISLRVADRFDELDDQSVNAKINGQTVSAAFAYQTVYDACGGSWINKKEGEISFNTSGLPEGINTVDISIADKAGNVLNETWKFTVDALPLASEWFPAKNSVIATSDSTVSLYITDRAVELDDRSFSAKLNGQPVNAIFEYKTLFDACGTFLGTNKREGTIKFQASGLQDGINTVEMSIADKAGKMLNEAWSFTVAEAPKITNLLPVNGVEIPGVTAVSAVIKDNTAVNWGSVKLYINNSEVSYTYNEETGELVYNYNFPTNSYQVQLKASDMNGNQSTADWSFVSDSTGPDLTKLLDFSDGMVITNGVLKFNAQLNDLVDIKDTVTLKLNGTPLDIDFRFKGYTDSCTDVYIIQSKKEAHVSYEKNVIDGENLTLELFAEDKFGNSRTWTWTFSAQTPPTIANETPVKYGVSQFQPTISATVSDNDHLASIVMKLNGVDVNYGYDSSTGKLTYIPSEPLTNETNYAVSVTATDGVGLTANRTWSFTINTYPDMYDGNVTSCQSCHENQSSRAPYEAVHRSYLFEGHYESCDNCHLNITIPDICSSCHSPGDVIPEPFPPHNLFADSKYSLKQFSSTVPLRLTTNRESWDCIICHQPGAGTKYRVSWSETRLLNNHDIPQLHAAPLTSDNESCIECHARSLTREHAREGRFDNTGQMITCNTCHMSTDAGVKAAITGKNKSCSACHGFADHESIHVGDLDSNCQTCHISALSQEHINNPKTNPDNNYSCETCHVSTADKKVKRTIAANNLNCAGCHTQGHNITIVDKVPTDIPLYNGFSWTILEASIFNGDPTSPAGYETGQVVISTRRNDVTIEGLWTFYNEKLTANGWKLKSGAPQPGAAFVSAEFEKQTRYLTLKCYDTMSDGEGSNPYGFKIEIWYK